MQLAAHLARIHLDQPRFDGLGVTPHRVVDLFLAQHLRGMAEEELEDLVLTASGGHHVPTHHHLTCPAVHAQVARLEDIDLRRHPAPAQRPDPGEHLLEMEGLCQVVIGAGIEAGQAVLDVIPSGEHQDCRRCPHKAKVAADIDAVEFAAEHDVEDGDVIREPRVNSFERLLAAQRDVDRKAGFGQPPSKAAGDLRFVLHDEYAHASIVCRVPACNRIASDSILAWMQDVIAADGDLVIRRMRDHPDDHERLVAWRNSPHVREWWDPDEPPLTMDAAIEEFRALADAEHPTTPCIIEVAGRPAGYIQFYPWDAEEEYQALVGLSLPEGSWGLDVFVAGDLAGLGIGSWAVRLLSDDLFAVEGATAVALVTESGNARAQAAYVRAGMRVSGEPFPDTDTRGGQRVESILMIRDRPAGTAGGQ